MSLPDHLLALLELRDLPAWAAALPTAELARVARLLHCAPPAPTRPALLRALGAYLTVPTRYSGLLGAWGARCRSAYAGATRPWPLAARLYGAHVHLVQAEAGSGVLLSPRLALTCAHCICHPDDPESDGDSGGGGSSPPPQRVGRTKVLLLPSGGYLLAQCIAAHEAHDLALLRITAASPLLAGVSAFPTCPSPTGKASQAVVCVGNPSEFDLESAELDATISFSPPLFHTSQGRVTGPTNPKRLRLGLGPMRHCAWTYWGHSGAPLINARGEVCGLHNSWDPQRGTRHCVSAEQVSAFVAPYLEADRAAAGAGAAEGAAAAAAAAGAAVGAAAAPAPAPAPCAGSAGEGGRGRDCGRARRASAGAKRTIWELPPAEAENGVGGGAARSGSKRGAKGGS